jgi:hypothetical protein
MPIKKFLSGRAMHRSRQGKGRVKIIGNEFQKVSNAPKMNDAFLMKTKTWTAEGVRKSYEKIHTTPYRHGIKKRVLIEYDPNTGKRLKKTVEKNH